MVKSARALWFIEASRSKIKPSPLPELGETNLLVKSSFSAISAGTERLVFQGLVPPALSTKMKVPYMKGDFTFPVKYGYSLVGEVIKGDDQLIGKRIHVMHPHQELVVVDKKDVSILPGNLPDQRASLISNTETCINAIWDSRVSIGDRVVVIGFGTIGSLLSMVLKIINYIDITVVEINADKVKLAEGLGFRVLEPNQIERDTYDVAFHCSATAEGLQVAVDCVGKEGKIVELSWYGTQSVNLNLGSSFHIQRKQIISSQVSTIPSHKQTRWNFDRRKQLAKELLSKSEFDNLITRIVKFDDLEDTYYQICTQSDELSTVISYD